MFMCLVIYMQTIYAHVNVYQYISVNVQFCLCDVCRTVQCFHIFFDIKPEKIRCNVKCSVFLRRERLFCDSCSVGAPVFWGAELSLVLVPVFCFCKVPSPVIVAWCCCEVWSRAACLEPPGVTGTQHSHPRRNTRAVSDVSACVLPFRGISRIK